MDPEAFKAKVEEAKASEDMRGQWWQLVYNEQVALRRNGFPNGGWTAEPTALTDYLRSLDRPVPTDDAEVVNMIQSITLVSAVEELVLTRTSAAAESGWCEGFRLAHVQHVVAGNQCSAQRSQCFHSASAWSGGASRSPSPVMMSRRSLGTFG